MKATPLEATEIDEEIRPNRRQEESSRKRARILEAAQGCFGEHGFAGATVEAIAADAGVSNGLLYQFFRNKEHLFETVLGEIIRQWVRAMVPREDEPAGAALEGMFRRSVEFCRANRLLPALLTGDRVLQLSRIKGVAADRVEPHRALVASILARGVASGEFRRDLDVASVADVICQLQAGYSSRAYRRDALHPDSPEIIDAAVRFMLDAVRAPTSRAGKAGTKARSQ